MMDDNLFGVNFVRMGDDGELVLCAGIGNGQVVSEPIYDANGAVCILFHDEPALVNKEVDQDNIPDTQAKMGLIFSTPDVIKQYAEYLMVVSEEMQYIINNKMDETR